MYQLAQVNVALTRFPLNDSRMEGFVSRLAEINAIAERSPGFVWRFKDEIYGSAEYTRTFGAAAVFNMSVWTSVQALTDFTYRSMHKDLFRDRGQRFEKMSTPHLALWWIEKDQVPTIGDAKARLDHLGEHGESHFAFTFRKLFPAPTQQEARAQRV